MFYGQVAISTHYNKVSKRDENKKKLLRSFVAVCVEQASLGVSLCRVVIARAMNKGWTTTPTIKSPAAKHAIAMLELRRSRDLVATPIITSRFECNGDWRGLRVDYYGEDNNTM